MARAMQRVASDYLLPRSDVCVERLKNLSTDSTDELFRMDSVWDTEQQSNLIWIIGWSMRRALYQVLTIIGDRRRRNAIGAAGIRSFACSSVCVQRNSRTREQTLVKFAGRWVAWTKSHTHLLQYILHPASCWEVTVGRLQLHCQGHQTQG